MGKPLAFPGVERKLRPWGCKVENYVASVCPEARMVLQAASESLNEAPLEDWKQDAELPEDWKQDVQGQRQGVHRST